MPSWFAHDAACLHRYEACRWDYDAAHLCHGQRFSGFYGGLQFAWSTWYAVGGRGSPARASEREQVYRAYLLWRTQGFRPWPRTSRLCGLR